MIVILPTLKHTGTFFTINALFGHWKGAKTDWSIDRILSFEEDYPGVLVSGHVAIDRYYEGALDLVARYPCVIPLRHPDAVTQSWQIRHDDKVGGHDLAQLPLLWDRLKSVYDAAIEPYILPIDHAPTRQMYFDAAVAGLGLSASTDWNIFRSYSGGIMNRKQGHRPSWVMDIYA